MIDFLTPLDYRHVSGDEVVLVAPFVVDLHSETILIPPGFSSDGASIPRPAWRVVGHPFGDYLESAVLHDWLYAIEWYAREGCDRAFLQAMERQEIALWRRVAIWRAVRDWGWLAWRSHTPTDIAAALDLLRCYDDNHNQPEQWLCPLGPGWEIELCPAGAA